MLPDFHRYLFPMRFTLQPNRWRSYYFSSATPNNAFHRSESSGELCYIAIICTARATAFIGRKDERLNQTLHFAITVNGL